MGRDRYERKHRRTAKNPACVEMMAGADFDAVPSLAAAMDLEPPMLTPADRDELRALLAEQAALDARYPVLVECRCIECERVFAAPERVPFCSPGCAAKWEGRQAA